VFSVCGMSMAQEKGDKLLVTVEVFSGRPNPTYEITEPGEINRLKDSLANLPALAKTEVDQCAFGRLGYRGIIISNPAGIEGIPGYVQILKGQVQVLSDSEARFFADAAGLEKRYLGLAKAQGLIAQGLLEEEIVPDPDAM